MIKQILPDLFAIYVNLPASPLKNLNSYVFRGNNRNLLVDTGFNRPECLTSLQEGIAELNLDMNRTDILITHCHADHCGLVNNIASPSSKLYMSAIDHKIANDFIEHDVEYWAQLEASYVREGFPAEEMTQAGQVNPARKFASDLGFGGTLIEEGQILAAGNMELRCIATPGHTPGHMCFYNEKARLMLTGDHVLFDITPNITVWKDLPNALEKYMASLRKIQKYDVALTLPGHREGGADLAARVDELLQHHSERLDDACAIVAKGGEMTAYQVAAKMKWDIKARDWADFPLSQKRFAVGEAMAHLVYLVEQGRLRKKEREGMIYYLI